MPDLNVIDATAELRLLRFLEDYTPPFDLIGTYRLIDDGVRPEATVTLRAGDQEMHEADLGVGPVDALANVLKKSLGQLFPEIPNVRLLDFKVRLIEGHIGTSSQIEVGIVFSDGRSLWKVASVDDNVNLASFRALLDGYEYAIYLWGKGKPKAQGPKAKGKGGSKIQDPKSKTRAGLPGSKSRTRTAAKPKTSAKAQSPKAKGKGGSKIQDPKSKTRAKAKTTVKTTAVARPRSETKAGTKVQSKSKAGTRSRSKTK